jgi:hypothetical protein
MNWNKSVTDYRNCTLEQMYLERLERQQRRYAWIGAWMLILGVLLVIYGNY